MEENIQSAEAAPEMSKMTALGHKLFGTKPNDGDIQPKEGIAYSITGFGQNLICTVIGSYLTVFMTDALGFNIDMNLGTITGVMAVAWLMLATRLFDAFNDPIMGSVVDRTRTKWGKCRPFLKWMAFPIAIATVLCFLPVYPQNLSGFIILSLVYVVWSVVYTVADVPYWGLSTAMTNNTTKRGNMLTIARLFCTAGAGLVTILVPIITDAVTAKYKNPDTGYLLAEFAAQNANTLKWTYFIVALVLVVIALPMFFYGFKNTKERYGATSTDNLPSLGHNLKLLFKNDQLMLVVLSGVLGAARMVYTYTGGLYFCKYALANESAYSVLTLLVVPGGLAASVLCPYLTKKFSKKWTFIGSHVIGAIAMLIMFFMWDFSTGSFINGGLAVCIICLILIGIPQGVSNIMTYAMIGDTVEYLQWKTGERAEGICFAMQTLINKIGMAVGAFIGVIAYMMSGISPSNPEGSLSVEGLNNLWMILVLSGVVSFVCCIIPMLFYKITENKQRELVAEIEARKVAENAAEENLFAGEAPIAYDVEGVGHVEEESVETAPEATNEADTDEGDDDSTK